MKKKTIIKLVIFIAVVLAAAIAAGVFFAGSGEEQVTDEDSEYKYSVTKSGKNLVISLTGKVPDEYVWVITGYDSEIVSANVGNNKVTVSPVAMGDTVVTIALEKSNTTLPDILYTLYVYVNVDIDLTLTATGCAHSDMRSISSSEGDAYTYLVNGSAEGSISVTIDAKTMPSPEVYIKNDILRKHILLESEEYIQYYFTVQGEGSETVAFYDSANGKAIILELSVDESGKVTVNSNCISEYDPEKSRIDNDIEDAEEIAGEIVFPEPYTVSECAERENSDGKKYVKYLLANDSNMYHFIVSSEMTVEELVKGYKVGDEAGKSVSLSGGLTGTFYNYESGYFIFWTSKDGRNCLVYSVNSDNTEVAEKIIQANPVMTK